MESILVVCTWQGILSNATLWIDYSNKIKQIIKKIKLYRKYLFLINVNHLKKLKITLCSRIDILSNLFIKTFVFINARAIVKIMHNYTKLWLHLNWLNCELSKVNMLDDTRFLIIKMSIILNSAFSLINDVK